MTNIFNIPPLHPENFPGRPLAVLAQYLVTKVFIRNLKTSYFSNTCTMPKPF